MLSGHKAILSALPLLAALSSRSGQAGETECLPYFLSTRENRRKKPHLVLIYSGLVPAEPSSSLLGAVLIYEYCIAGMGIRIFSTADWTGRRNVWACPEDRARVTARAARALWERGAQIMQIVFSESHRTEAEACCNHEICSHHAGTEERELTSVVTEELRCPAGRRASGSWTLLQRDLPMFLPLLGTMDKTLARIGKGTRFNLRYYRRRTERELGSEFCADVQVLLGDLQQFNRICAFPVSEELLRWRFASLAPDAFAGVVLHGIRDRAGHWLSLVCGRRHNRSFELDWQMNRADAAAYSLSLVMRSCLIEYEIAQGSTRLYIEGGSAHPIMHSFVNGRVGELTLKRSSWYARLVVRFASKLLPPKNYLAQTLHNPALEWNSLGQ